MKRPEFGFLVDTAIKHMELAHSTLMAIDVTKLQFADSSELAALAVDLGKLRYTLVTIAAKYGHVTPLPIVAKITQCDESPGY